MGKYLGFRVLLALVLNTFITLGSFLISLRLGSFICKILIIVSTS